jgi:acetyl esterase/lipase
MHPPDLHVPRLSFTAIGRHVFRRVVQSACALLVAATSMVAHADDVRLFANVPYGADPLQRMDVYVPAGNLNPSLVSPNSPVIVMVHGGGWQRGDKTSPGVVQEKVARWVPMGFVLVSVNYRLYPQVSAAQEAQDVALALATAQRHAGLVGANPDKFILMGHSAGAHLVALLNANPAIAQAQGAKPWLGTVALDSAALNLPAIMNTVPHYSFYDEVFGTRPAYWYAMSPYHQLVPSAHPMQLVCSSVRPDNPCGQAQEMANLATTLNVRATVLPEPLQHDEINATLGLESDYTRAVEAFMGSLDPLVARHLPAPLR